MKARSGTPLNTSSADAAATQQNGHAGGAADRVHDLSLLRMPIGTSISGFAHVHQAFERGTAEIQHMLGHECDLIFECRVCRNIFRSLANFLSHKRIYCTTRFTRQKHCHFQLDDVGGNGDSDIGHRLDADCTQIVQLEQDFAEARPTTVLGAKGAFRDLSSVIERLRRREGATRSVVAPLAVKEESVTAENKVPVVKLMDVPGSSCGSDTTVMLQLDRIPSSSAAVFQTLRTDEPLSTGAEQPSVSADSIKTDVLELHYLQQNGPVMVLDDAGKALPAETALTPSEVQASAAALTVLDGQRVVCTICQMNFGTEKTLQLHVDKYHVPSTYVYPCPSCTRTFLRPSAIMQHLNVDHKKSIRRLRQMRETILRRRTRISQIQVKGPSRELARLQQSERADAAHRRTTWPDNYTGIMTDTLVGSAAADVVLGTAAASAAARLSNGGASKTRASLCAFCGKAFERRAALSTHLKTCTAKQSQVGGSGGTANCMTAGGSNGQMDDESNSNSMDSFMAMVNREKSMHARAHELEQLEMRQREAVRQQLDQQQPSQQPQLPLSTTGGPATTVVVAEPAATGVTDKPNRRKRSHARKSVQTAMQVSGDMDFQWDDANGVNNSTISFAPDQRANSTESTTVVASHIDDTKPTPNRNKRTKLLSTAAFGSPADSSAAAAATVVVSSSATTPLSLSPDIDIEQRPTDCTICDKKFANLSNLRRHVAMFHYREKKFACKLCEFKAFRKVDVLNHIASAHPFVRHAGGGSGIASCEAGTADATDSTIDWSDLVELIEVDKNKYSEERGRAVAASVERMNERIGSAADEENSCSPPNGPVSDMDGDESRPEIIIPLLDELEEVDFELIPMEEFTVVRSESTRPNVNDVELVTIGTGDGTNTSTSIIKDSSSSISTKAPKAASNPSAPIRRRGRPKGSTKSALLTSLLRTTTMMSKRPNEPKSSSDPTSLSMLEPPTADSPPALNEALSPMAGPADNTFSTIVAKLVRHPSINSTSSSEDVTSSGRRPIRNRIKIANKDFVYDLSSLTEVRHYAPILGRNQQRRKAANAAMLAKATQAAAEAAAVAKVAEDAHDAAATVAVESQLDESSSATTSDITVISMASSPAETTPAAGHSPDTTPSTPVPVIATPIAVIPGAAMAMALQAVGQHRACFSRPPEMPASHAIVPAKIIALRRSEGAIEWRVVEPAVAAIAAISPASDGSASPLRRASNEQLIDMLVAKRRDTLMDKYHSVAKQTPRRLQKALSSAALLSATKTSVSIGRKRKAAAAAAAAALLVSDSMDVALPETMPNTNNGQPIMAVNEDERRSGQHRPEGDISYSQSHSAAATIVAAPLTPCKQRLTAVERLAEIKERKLQETLRMLNLGGSESEGTAEQRTSESH